MALTRLKWTMAFCRNILAFHRNMSTMSTLSMRFIYVDNVNFLLHYVNTVNIFTIWRHLEHFVK